MRHFRQGVGLAALVAGGGWVFGACGVDPEPVAIGLVMSAPQGLLDDATSVSLRVFPAEDRTCEADGGPSAEPVDPQEFALTKEGCAAGATWCGEISLPRDGSVQMFHVEATDASGILAQGCATATIDQDPVEVDITIVRYVPPPCCNDGILQTGELCDTGEPAPTACDGGAAGECSGIVADAVCACDCSTVEVPVDRQPSDPAPSPVGQGHLALVFAPGTGQLSNGLRGVYQTSSSDSSADVALRAFDQDFFPITSPAALGNPQELQISCSGGGSPLARSQREPSATVVGSDVLVAYTSNTLAPLRYDVVLSTVNTNGCSTASQPLAVSDASTTTAGARIAAGPGGDALILWQQGDAVRGRVLSGGTLGTEFEIAASGAAARVAGTSTGWMVVYEGSAGGDDDGIVAVSVDPDGTVGTPILVNAATAGAQTEPDVAVASSGDWIVTWTNGGDVFAQRFDPGGTPLAGDQEAALHGTTSGTQRTPAVVAGTAPAFFLVAWESDGAIRGRFLGVDGGFLYNPVDGQNTDFAASPASEGSRKRPALAVGEHVAIGWEDDSAGHAGVWVRRFPMPTATAD